MVGEGPLPTIGQPILRVENVSKSFGATSVLRDINFDVKYGEVVCLIGPSGSGKSTMALAILRLLAFRKWALHRPQTQRAGGPAN